MEYENPTIRTAPQRRVRRIDLMTREVNIYASVTEAGSYGYDERLVYRACKHRRTTYRGYYWEFIDKEPMPRNLTGVRLDYLVPTRRVRATHLDTGEIKEYQSASHARVDGFTPFNVGRTCQGRQKSHNGYVWEYIQ